MSVGPGTVLAGRYEIIRLLGQGGMGSVYEVRHTGTRKRMALKVITADISKHPGLVARFQVEARASGAIESQHIAQVFDVGADETLGVPYMAMEYLVGEDLEQLLHRLHGQLPQDLALRIVAQACAGLEMAHAADVVHRDIKPANIYVTRREGEEIVIKLLDFGIAKLLQDQEVDSPSLTRTGSLIGSPLYMSPEQARGRRGGIDQRTDIWSMGIVLHQLLCGRTPFQNNDALGDLIIAICSEPPPSVQEQAPWVAPEVADIIARALEIEVERRYQTVGEMLTDIRALLPEGSTRITPSMLGPLDEAARSAVAPRISASRSGSTAERPGERLVKLPTGPGAGKTTGAVAESHGAAASTAVSPGAAASTSVSSTSAGSVTTGAVAADAPPGARARSPLVIVGAAAAIAIGVVVAVALFGSGAASSPSSASPASDSPPPAPTAEAATKAPPAPAPEPAGPTPPVVSPSGDAPAATVSAAAPPKPTGPALGPRPPAAPPTTASPAATPPPALSAPPPKKNPLDVTIK